MRQVLPSLLKTLHRGQKSSICESGKGDEGGRPSEASCLPRSVFSKSSFPKLTPHISMISVHDEPIPKKKAFSSPRLKKFRRGSGGRAPAMALDTPRTGTRPSSDSPRCTVNRDATPPGGGLSGAGWQVGGQTSELCAPVFAPTLEWENRDQAFCWQGRPSRYPRERKRGFSAIQMLHNSPN